VSCVVEYLDGAGAAVDPDPVATVQAHGGVAAADDGGDAQFAGHDRGVRQRRTQVRTTHADRVTSDLAASRSPATDSQRATSLRAAAAFLGSCRASCSQAAVPGADPSHPQPRDER
jgi:hypothetical protein